MVALTLTVVLGSQGCGGGASSEVSRKSTAEELAKKVNEPGSDGKLPFMAVLERGSGGFLI